MTLRIAELFPTDSEIEIGHSRNRANDLLGEFSALGAAGDEMIKNCIESA
jgi:hypothetical protein